MTRFRVTDPDPLRCRYLDCEEQHPVAPSEDDGITFEEEEVITCPTCREAQCLPPLEEP